MEKNEELKELKKLLKVLLELEFSEKRIDYYMQEFRKVGFYESEEERIEYIKTLRETIKKEYERKNKKVVQI